VEFQEKKVSVLGSGETNISVTQRRGGHQKGGGSGTVARKAVGSKKGRGGTKREKGQGGLRPNTKAKEGKKIRDGNKGKGLVIPTDSGRENLGGEGQGPEGRSEKFATQQGHKKDRGDKSQKTWGRKGEEKRKGKASLVNPNCRKKLIKKHQG